MRVVFLALAAAVTFIALSAIGWLGRLQSGSFLLGTAVGFIVMMVITRMALALERRDEPEQSRKPLPTITPLVIALFSSALGWHFADWLHGSLADNFGNGFVGGGVAFFTIFFVARLMLERQMLGH